jgi:3-carboxy-cis,cis-muconate cycloisomerase
MRRNLDLSGPVLLSEGVSAAVAPLLAGDSAGRTGKQQLQAIVDRTLQAPAAGQAATYRRLLRAAVPAELLSDARLEELLDPAGYLGQAAEISRRILAAYPEFATATPNGANRG